jgi:photosystem II stability/assembly factor-like uncharacterized protein
MRRMRKMVMILLLIFFAFGVMAQSEVWIVETTGISTNLRGISAANTSGSPGGAVIWASGSSGAILRSEDTGASWKRLRVEGADALDFRGIRAFNERIAYVISSGEGDKSRIYKTVDGGETWEMQYTDTRPAFFLDDIVCFTEMRCFALGDPIDGKFLILSTEDGKHWKEMPRDNMPAIITGEGAFAASGTSLAIYGASDIYFGTGGGAKARVFHSKDLGRTWTAADTPLAAGNASSGVFSIVRFENTVVAVGGDYRVANGNSASAAYSFDGGATWRLSAEQPNGYRSAVAHVGGALLISIGPNGEDLSNDSGQNWFPSDYKSMNAVVTLDGKNAWGAGAKGTIARFELHRKRMD